MALPGWRYEEAADRSADGARALAARIHGPAELIGYGAWVFAVPVMIRPPGVCFYGCVPISCWVAEESCGGITFK